MTWSDWHSLHSDGSIPEELVPCEYWQLKWLIQWSLTAPEDSFGDTLRGRWIWHIAQNTSDVFNSEVRVSGTAVWLSDPLFGGPATLSSWWVEQGLTEVRTDLPIKPAILGADPDAWTQRSDGSWANPAEPGFVDGWSDSVGAGGSDVPVYVDYTSAPYNIPLSDGAKVSVPFRNVGAVWIVKLAGIQIRTMGLGGFATLVDRVGIHRVAKPESQRLRQHFSRDGGSTWETWRTPMRLAAPSIAKGPTNDLVVGGQIAEVGWGYYVSQNDGLSWGEHVLVFDTSYSDARFAVTRDGFTVAIARKGGVLWCRTERDGFAATVRVGEASAAFELAVEATTGRIIAEGSALGRYVSYDGGASWTPSATSAE